MTVCSQNAAAAEAAQTRFTAILEALCRVMAADAHARGLAGELVLVIFTRLRRLAGRFAAAISCDPTHGRDRPA